MKKFLALALVLLVVAIVSTSVFATTGSTNRWLKNPFLRLWNAIHVLQDQVQNISIIEGPQGPAGECSCSVTTADFQALTVRVQQLEAGVSGYNLPDCILDADCYDNNICTDEVCDFFQGCVYSYNQNSCDDNNPDTVNDVCNSGICSGTSSSGTGGGGGTGDSGGLVITEIMYNPDAVSDTAGEWFEVYNPGSSAVNLNGWTIQDLGTDSFTFSQDVLVQPSDYAVLCKNTDNTLNGGIICDAGYSSFTLGNTADAIVILNPNNEIIDDVSYDISVDPWKILNIAGYSLQLDYSHYSATDNDDGVYWCNAFDSYGTGDYGTPGTVNSDCNAG
ncbi:lamin tail domain-containing protein [Candidatus Woesearchaeota archaeon]|nr:lamin tail domain-containing protein [Candidatus Woesearchaeota archaeon]